MKKQGYTLAEILICLGIIGILAAILLPLANKYKPDGIKATYVKTYYTLVETIREIASNQAIYPLTDSNFTYSYNKAPLFNLEEVTIGKDENGNPKKYGGDEAKLCEVLSEFFPQSLEGEVSCQKGTITYSDTIFSTPSFTTNKGVQFVIGTETDGQTNYQTDIYVDLNGEKGNNCLYDSKKCKAPDRFKFIITGDGHVIPSDPMGQEYLKTRMNWRKTDVTPEGALLSSIPDEWAVSPELITKSQSTPDPEPEPEPEKPSRVDPTVTCPYDWLPPSDHFTCGIPDPQCTKGISWYCSCPSGWTRLSNASCRPLEPNIKCPEGYQLNIVGTNMYDYDPSCTLIPDSGSAEE